MEEDFFGLYDEEQQRQLFRKFEKMNKDGRVRFLDVAEFEELINAFLDTGDLEKAGQAVDAALKQHPASSSLQLLQADLLVRKNRVSDALSTLTYLKNVEPDNPEVTFLNGVAKLRLSLFDEAFHCFAQAIKHDPDGDMEMAMRAGRQLADFHCYPQALTCFETALIRYPGDTEIIYEIFAIWESMENPGMTLRWIYNYLDEDPFSVEMWYLAAAGELHRRRLSKALEAVDYAIALLPDQDTFYMLRAVILGKMKKSHNATGYFKSLIPDLLSHEMANLMIAIAYAEKGDMKRALRKLPAENHLPGRQKDNIDLYTARIYGGLGRRDIVTGIFESAFERKTQDIPLLTAAYRFFRLNNYREKAFTALKLLVNADPFRLSYREKLIGLAGEIRNGTRIDALYRTSINDMPGVADLHYGYGTFLIRNGDEGKGLRYFRNGLILDFKLHEKYLRKYPGLQKESNLKLLIEQLKTRKHEL